MRPRCASIALLAVLLAACGGGSVVVSSGGFFLDVHDFGPGFDVSRASTGQLSAAIAPGQSIEFDASSPASWSVSVDGGPAASAGTTIVVGGLSITTVLVTGSRIRVTTAVAPNAFALPATVVLTAFSLADAREAATVTLQIR